MKKTILLVAALISVSAYSQVGINTENPKATLDIAGMPTDLTKVDGVIVPRITGNELKAKDALYGTAQTGTIIYTTSAAFPTTTKTAEVTAAGFYYFNGSIWKTLGSGLLPNNDWSINGNTGTIAGTNFIGTTDDVDFIIKRNNIQSAWLDSNTTGNDNTAFGVGSLPTSTLGSSNTAIGSSVLVANTNGNFNTGIGSFVLRDNTTGERNTGIGTTALNKNTTGNSNTSLGQYSLALNTTGSDNTALGASALGNANKTGNSNTAVGSRAMFISSSEAGSNNVAVGYEAYSGDGTVTDYGLGSNNTIVGSNAGRYVTGSNNTFLGRYAGFRGVEEALSGSGNILIGANTYPASITASNQMNIANSIFGTGMTGTLATPAGNIGINVSAPTANFHTNGTVRHQTLPANDNNTLFMTTDANGNVATRQANTILPTILAGGNGTDATSTSYTISSINGANTEQILTNRNFTLSKRSAVTFSYSVGMYDILRSNGSPITDGVAKQLGTRLSWSALPGGSPFSVGGTISRSSVPFTNSGNIYASGTYFVNGSRTIILDPGTYGINMIGYVYAFDNVQGVQVTFNGAVDQLDIVAVPLQ